MGNALLSFRESELYAPIQNWNQKGMALLTGERGIYRLALHWEYAFAQAGLRIFNLDCAIRFNPFVITQETRKRNVPPEPLLDRILVQRAFTPYQILDTLHRLLKEQESNTIYFLLAPCKQFLDGDVQEEEGIFLLHKMLHCLERFQEYRIPLLVIESVQYRHKNFQMFFPKLLQASPNLWELKIEEGLSRIKIRRSEV
ncbi:hypothetical protein LPTSP4_11700 [Leptospira ryugenii]|uniref:Uncharacterized protein n=1 Tax=Leptospira ryugenii TaxID=1917863 RepID=A0A2P2DYE1_9LEPT|nr:hypothetical protein [Leptospira ryugenii]GBF49654.1 hypothetical protein LPTSP4_11700 [Leptospira ryugenii]